MAAISHTNDNVRISIQFSMKFVPKGLIDSKSALIQAMACRLLGVKPLPGPILTEFIDAWASCQIRKIASAHAPGMPGTFSPPPRVVFFKTRGHLSRLAWPTQRDGLSCLASPRLALRCAAWPSKTSPDSCSRPVATSGCSHRYYNDNAKCINIAFFSVSEAMFLYKNDCLKWQNIILKK